MIRSALVLAVALVACAAAIGCSGSATLGGTPTPVATATPDPLQTWLAPARQQLLLSTLQELTGQAGWVAGCVFETTEDRGVLASLKKPAGRAFFSEFTNAELGAALAARVEGTPAVTNGFVGAAPNAHTYCYVPKP